MNLNESILKAIEKDARVDIAELAVRLDVSETDIANAMSDMEKEGIICGYHTMIDWDKTSVDKVNALIEVRVTPQRGQGFDSHLNIFAIPVSELAANPELKQNPGYSKQS